MIIKIILFIVILFTGFICGGAMATKYYRDRLVVLGRYVDSTTNQVQYLSDSLLACRTTLEIGRGL